VLVLPRTLACCWWRSWGFSLLASQMREEIDAMATMGLAIEVLVLTENAGDDHRASDPSFLFFFFAGSTMKRSCFAARSDLSTFHLGIIQGAVMAAVNCIGRFFPSLVAPTSSVGKGIFFVIGHGRRVLFFAVDWNVTRAPEISDAIILARSSLFFFPIWM